MTYIYICECGAKYINAQDAALCCGDFTIIKKEENKMKKLCIYHGNCADGFTAAWAVKQKFGEDNVDFHAGFYGDDAPDVTGRDVIIVDFSYKRDVMLKMGKSARSVLVLDHHKSAYENLSGFPAPLCVIGRDAWEGHLADVVSAIGGVDPDLPRVIFDMDRSGAMIAWNYFHPTSTAPELVRYVQDRDIWKFELPYSKEFSAALFALPYEFNAWDAAVNAKPQTMIDEGVAILRKHNKDIAELIKSNKARRMDIGGFNVPVINVPYMFGSDTCHVLCEGEPFAAYYHDLGDDRNFGLRSAEDGEDVSKIAAQYGGGGHKHASGFNLKGFNNYFKKI